MAKEIWYTLPELKCVDAPTLFRYYLVSGAKAIRNSDLMAQYEMEKAEKALRERSSNECSDFLKALDESKRDFLRKEDYGKVRGISSIEKRFHERVLGNSVN